MNSENADTELSLQMHKLPCAHFFFFGGGGGGVGGGGGGGGTLCARDNTVCRP